MTAEDDEPQEEVDLFNLDNDEEKKKTMKLKWICLI